jgi:methionyl-tRNA synthetase
MKKSSTIMNVPAISTASAVQVRPSVAGRLIDRDDAVVVMRPASGLPRRESQAAYAFTPVEELIGIETFAQVDLRVGQIVVAERIPNADKLLRLEVDLAEEKPRQLLAGIAEWYAPESLIGQKIIVVSNLQSRRMRGLESQGMLLAADAEGRPMLATVPVETPNGARLR